MIGFSQAWHRGIPNMLDSQHKGTESGMQVRALLLEGRRPGRIVI